MTLWTLINVLIILLNVIQPPGMKVFIPIDAAWTGKTRDAAEEIGRAHV